MKGAITAAGVVALTLLLVILTGGGERQEILLKMPSTGGLREGSDVRIAGATVGRVAKLNLGRDDVVETRLEIDRDKAEVFEGATASIRANNLLGEKYVQLTRGSGPAPEQLTIPTKRIRYPVDLDEVLSVLDAPTRTRLTILINEAGLAVTGRKADFSQMLQVAPRSFDNATALLESLNRDNAALGRAIDQSGTVIGRLAPKRRELAGFVDTAGQALETVAQRRADLAETIDRAPGTLRNARGLLRDLRQTAVPLRPAAQLAASIAPALNATLDEIPPFTAAASPTLGKATAAAPKLTQLGSRATPVLRAARRPLGDLAALSEAAPPLTKALDSSIDGVLMALQGWARAIQGRDNIGHVFRGHLGFGPEAMDSLIKKLSPAVAKRPRRKQSPAPRLPVLTPTPGPSGKTQTPRLPLPDVTKKPAEALKELLDQLPEGKLPGFPSTDGILGGVLGGGVVGDKSADQLLDFLLGK